MNTAALRDLVAVVSTQHHRVEVIRCRATSLGPVVVPHSHEREPSPAMLRCTELAHGGDHTDGAHCWRVHTFTRQQATEPVNRDESLCSCGKAWPTADYASQHSDRCGAAALIIAILADESTLSEVTV